MYYAAEEKYYLEQGLLAINANKQSNPAPLKYDDGDAYSCFITAITSFIGLNDARNLWRSILAGAAEQTVIATLKLMARRTAFAITVVSTVYSVGSCLDWW